MSAIKQNDNGPLPDCPRYDAPVDKALEQVLREETEDADLRKAEAARRAGMCDSYTKPAWRRALK